MWKKILVILVALVVFDAIYFQFIYGSFNKMIQKIQGSPITLRIESAIVCYLALTGLLYYFIIIPNKPATDAALLGLGTYLVYETTSYATLKNWQFKIALMDSLWGGALFYLVTQTVYLLKI